MGSSSAGSVPARYTTSPGFTASKTGGSASRSVLEEAGVAHAGAERDRGGRDGLGVSPVVVVDREGVDGGVVGEGAPRPVAVVQVEVHHEHGLREAAPAQPPDRDRDVVEDAEPEPGVGHRVVEAAPEVHDHPARPQGEAGRLDGAARHQPLQVERRLRLAGGHLDAEDAGEGVRLLDRVQVLGGVDPQQVLERRRAGLGDEVADEEPGLLERAQDLLAAQRVHRHAEDAPLVAGVVHDRYAPRPQAVERAAGGPEERAERAVAQARPFSQEKTPTWPTIAGRWLAPSTSSCPPRTKRAPTSCSGASSTTSPARASPSTRRRRRRSSSSSRAGTSS